MIRIVLVRRTARLCKFDGERSLRNLVTKRSGQRRRRVRATLCRFLVAVAFFERYGVFVCVYTRFKHPRYGLAVRRSGRFGLDRAAVVYACGKELLDELTEIDDVLVCGERQRNRSFRSSCR